LGSRSPAISAASMARPETPKMSLATTLSAPSWNYMGVSSA
jgi:hypothetical protein